MLSYCYFLINLTLKVTEFHSTVFVEYISLFGAFLRYGHRAGVYIDIVVSERNCNGYVGMSVQKDIAFFEGRRVIGIEFMTVGHKKSQSVYVDKCVIGKNGKFQHHFVDLCLAISSYAKYIVLNCV